MDLMGTPSHPHTPDCAATTAGLLPVPATLPQWERTMQRARAAGQMGQMAMALAFEQQALALALRLCSKRPRRGGRTIALRPWWCRT